MTAAAAPAKPRLPSAQPKRRVVLPASGWEPRAYQLPLWDYLEGGGTDANVVAHRRWGKDDVALHWAAVAAHQRIAPYWHMLPEYAQGRKAIWRAINPHTGRRRIDEAFPKELRAQTVDDEMFIRLKCGSTWQVIGSDNYDSLVGAPPAGITASEWARANPAAWAYLAPILAENGGWWLSITTPIGRNHAKAMLDRAKADPKAFAQVSTVEETGAIAMSIVEAQREKYHAVFGEDAGDALIEQEYWCSFEAAVLGSYFGKALIAAEREGRIRSVPYEPELPVHTVWDLGKGANMAIWLFQIAHDGIRIIGCLQGAHDEVIPDLVEKLMRLPYRWGIDFVPHDAKVKELGTGKTRVETLIALKRNPQLVPDHRVQDGINAARLLLRRCWFDLEACADGLEALRQYKAEFDDVLKVFKNTPLHDWTSHFADAFRYLAMAAREVKPPVIVPVKKGPRPGQVLLPGAPRTPSGVRIRI
jgi:phage terminase large subunit